MCLLVLSVRELLLLDKQETDGQKAQSQRGLGAVAGAFQTSTKTQKTRTSADEAETERRGLEALHSIALLVQELTKRSGGKPGEEPARQVPAELI